jgi:5-amino-6-(5-phospho-D-ribitylamino)uracil phosphatase
LPNPRVIYVVDLDGTLLQNDATLSVRSREILVHLLEDGLPLVVASARSVVAMKIILSSVPVKNPVIEFNGAFLSELATGKHLWTHALEPRLAIELFGMIKEAGHIPFFSTFDGKKDWLYCVSGQNPGMDWYVEDRRAKGDGRLCLVTETGTGLNDQVVCFTVIGEDSKLRPLAERIRCVWGTKT